MEQLVELWTQTKQLDPNSSSHHSPNSYIVSVFWALLLLSAQSKVELIQEEFYQDVKIRLIADAQEHSSNLSSALSLVEV